MKNILRIVVIFSGLFFIFCGTAYAMGERDIESKEPMTNKEVYELQGFTEDVDKLIKNYENKFDTHIILPQNVPFKVKEKYGKVEGTKLIIDYISQNKDDYLKITVDSDQLFHGKQNYVLKNGTKVFIQEVGVGPDNKRPHLTWLFLERNNLEYGVALDYHKKEMEKAKLISIAESMYSQ